MPNFDGLWTMRYRYSTVPTGFIAMEHRLTFDVKMSAAGEVGDTFDNFLLTRRDGDIVDAETWAAAFTAILKTTLNATSEIATAELWFTPEGTTDSTFYSVLAIGEVGSQVGNAAVAQQTTLTFRSAAGGIARIQVMEGYSSGNQYEYPPYSLAPFEALSDLVVSAASPVIARDNAFLIAPNRMSNGQNEKLWRKRYRP